MPMLIQVARAPCLPHSALPAIWSKSKPAASIDALLDRAMALARVGAWSCDLFDDTLSWTSGVYDIFGLPSGTSLDRRQTVQMYTEESREALDRVRGQAVAVGGVFTLDAQINRHDGEMRWIRINGEMVRRPGSTPILHGAKQDVTEEKLRTDTLRRLAENDALTGLASRAVYEHSFLNRRRVDSPAMPIGALILFDLDGFKQINDRWGHLAGDACLKVFAERLSASFPRAVLTARIGGDEFAVIVSNDEPLDQIEDRIAAFLARLRAPILWREHMFMVGATSGIAAPADPYCYDAEELFVNADAVLYAAKRARSVNPATARR